MTIVINDEFGIGLMLLLLLIINAGIFFRLVGLEEKLKINILPTVKLTEKLNQKVYIL